ncbi:restriction endonuclease [Psychroflexus sp. MBR-150]|jgi:hypothetical protein
MKSFPNKDFNNYITLLSAIAKLSGLFSESSIPFINYRVAENIFCKAFNAENLSRSDTAYDAKMKNTGIGLKTFTCQSNNSLEKIAEFNSKANELLDIKNDELAYKLSEFRNERILLANRLYDIKDSLYHIVARKNKQLVLFDTDYAEIDLDRIRLIKETKAGIKFSDGINEYSFNRSKSTLYRRFYISKDAYFKDIDILKDPFELILKLFKHENEYLEVEKQVPGVDYVVLPLYGYNNGDKFVFPRSGLNQWNARGRKRDFNEVYIPVPAIIHHKFPNFFPPILKNKKLYFDLHLPNGKTYKAKMCQTAKIKIDGEVLNKGKGLMTSSNKGLGEWILRKALQLKENELVKYRMLEVIGYDSVIIEKVDEDNYKIDVLPLDSYEDFIDNT